MSEAVYTYRIEMNTDNKFVYKVYVYKDGRQIYSAYADTKWGARRKAREAMWQHKYGNKVVEEGTL